MLYFLNNLYIRIILWGFFSWFAVDANSQSIIDAHDVEVTYNKTSSIVFPSVITSVDRGSSDLIAQKAKGVGNVLQLKANRKGFSETNLTVITADGMLHHFIVNYAEQPSSLTIEMNEVSKRTSGHIAPLIFQAEMTEDQFNSYADRILKTKKAISFHSDKKNKISIVLRGIYIHENTMFYHLRLANHSNINYDTDLLRFSIRDKSKIKRTASQEVELTPVFVFGDDKLLKGKHESDIVYALEKFTIPDAKHLNIEMLERNGGRNLNLLVNNRAIVNARLIP
jgi:conjugative transposon TraN protein